MNPLPGTATESDLLRKHGSRRALYELVDGTLVEKSMGHKESAVGLALGAILWNFLQEHDLGYCTGADDLVRVMPKVVRGPDVAFVSWDDSPGAVLCPDADQHESRSEPRSGDSQPQSNTRKEMQIKLKEYFLGGVKLVWIIDPEKRTAEAYTAPDKVTAILANGTLDGGGVLPGFTLPLTNLFAKFGPPSKKPTKRKKK